MVIYQILFQLFHDAKFSHVKFIGNQFFEIELMKLKIGGYFEGVNIHYKLLNLSAEEHWVFWSKINCKIEKILRLK